MTYPHGGAGQIWRDGEDPAKGQIRDWGVDVENRIVAVEAAATGTARYYRDTLAELSNIATPALGDVAYVLDDPGNTGTYRYDGASWVREADLPVSLKDVDILREELAAKADLEGGKVPVSQLPEFVQSINGSAGAVTINPSSLGLGNVDNTSDANKPISTAVEQALASKAEASNVALIEAKTNNLTVTQPANVDNIKADVNGPLSRAVVEAGTWTPSANDPLRYPNTDDLDAPVGTAIKRGFRFRVVGATTTIDGIEYVAGDYIVAQVSGPADDTYAANWRHEPTIYDSRIDQMVEARVDPVEDELAERGVRFEAAL
ncbi:MAG: hypothetical protein AAFR45_06960, partial [Pseudomonadota bacterium]